jgi:biotin-dependent carboxylase-like uncharacterized protein
LGVAVGGAADRFSLAVGNALVGNEEDACALEVSLHGPALKSDHDVACVLFGAPFEITSDRQRLRAGVTFTLHADEEVRVGGTSKGMRAYFCVGGGFRAPSVLKSRSGPSPIRAGDNLACSESSIPSRFVVGEFEWNREPEILRVLDGPQASWFETGDFYSQEFSVLAASNRMGLRLAERPLALPTRELTSEPVCPGSVQVTGDGQCIVLGVEGQTIGGYPKIAQIVTAELDKLGQLRPGDRIQFAKVDLGQAKRLYRLKKNELNECLMRLRTAELFGS